MKDIFELNLQLFAGAGSLINATTAYVAQREAAGAAFVIRPAAPLNVGHVEHDPDKLRACYEQGRAACEARLSALRAFLNAPD